MGNGALHDAVSDIGVVPTTQRLRKNRALDRKPVIIVVSYVDISLKLPLALLKLALRIEWRLPAVRMQTS